MGEVFAAVDDVLGRDVAVKTLLGSIASRTADERFRNEARAIARLSHPGVVQLFDIDLDASPPYLVMERVAGPSLKEHLAGGPLSVADMRVLGIQIARALAAAHVQNVVHRDVKPANILRAGEGLWKLADFGVAHVPDSGLTMTGQFVGSPAYASPEALVKGLCDPEGDVFGLGATLYHAVAGTWPRLEATTGGLLAPTPPLATLAPHVPADVAAAIDACLALDSAHRPTAAALASALATANPTSSSVGPVPPPLAPVTPLRRVPRWVFGVAALLVLGVIAAVASRGGTAPPTAVAPRPAEPGSVSEPEPTPADPTVPRAPTRITVATPPMDSEKAAKDWRKLVEHLQRGKFGEARKKLGDWERKYGESAETASLRQQLEGIPDEDLGPPGHRGPPGHGDEDD
jgi:serine/threonine-protein kinase